MNETFCDCIESTRSLMCAEIAKAIHSQPSKYAFCKHSRNQLRLFPNNSAPESHKAEDVDVDLTKSLQRLCRTS